MTDDKWLMFKNYMHNELGITKDDIRAWIKEAAEEQAKKLVQQEFGKFDMELKIATLISKEFNDYYNSRFREELARQIINKLVLNVKE